MDKMRAYIESVCDAPTISCNWSASDREIDLGRDDGHRRVDIFRAVPDYVRRRKRKAQTPDEHEACEQVLYFLKYYQGKGIHPIYQDQRDQWSHTILGDMADWSEHRSGSINAHAQAVLREEMLNVDRKEHLGL